MGVLGRSWFRVELVAMRADSNDRTSTDDSPSDFQELKERRFVQKRRDRTGLLLNSARLVAMSRSGMHCSFPDCSVSIPEVLEVAHIRALAPGGPRYSKLPPEADPFDNVIVLCASHHRLVDYDAETYTAALLKRFRDDHIANVDARLSGLTQGFADEIVTSDKALSSQGLSYAGALDVWNKNRTNSDEEFWQKLFDQYPTVLSLTMHKHIIHVGSTAYLGGKSLANAGGKIVDFIYANDSSQNAILVEIKTPMTKLLGPEYRNGMHSISHDLSGSIVQALTYRNELMHNYYTLVRSDHSKPLKAFNPECVVLAGDASTLSDSEVRSFDLFCLGLKDVVVLTFDNLFAKVKHIFELADDA
jgi:hypothetical protein